MYVSTEKLCQNFLGRQEDKIVLYGLGAQTREILSECSDSRIIGVLDGFRQDGMFCGKPILSLYELPPNNVKIVIIARSASERIIYRRIRDVCDGKKIPVYNLQGKLLKPENQVCGHPYFQKDRRELLRKAAEYDTVSFDIFDTLLMRKISDRETFFRMIEQKHHTPFPFAKWRMLAEFELSANDAPTINDIYEWIHRQTGIAEEELSALLHAELSLEEALSVPRHDMADILRRLAESGKKVYLISDMYLPKHFIRKLLDGGNISGYEDILISCEYGTGKGGCLFERYKELFSGDSRLHIGDSDESDGNCANKSGIDSYLVKSAAEMAELTTLGLKMEECGGTKGIRGLIYAAAFNDPFALYQSGSRVILKNAQTQGYALLGPLLMGYVHWLYRNVKDRDIDCILFISRDGYLVRSVYDLYLKDKKGPRSLYFRISRSLAVLASVETPEDIVYAAALPFSGTPKDMLLKRFQLREEEMMQSVTGESDIDYILRHKELILNKAGGLRANYKEYYKHFALQKGKTAMFDFVSTGTCQTCLEKILRFPIKGFYFEKIADTDTRKQSLDIQDFVHSGGRDAECADYFLIETWIKAIEPTVTGVTPQGEIVSGQSRISKTQAGHIAQIQKGALRFCSDYLEMERLGLNEDIEKLALHLLTLIDEENVEMSLKGWEYFDEFSNRAITWE